MGENRRRPDRVELRGGAKARALPAPGRLAPALTLGLSILCGTPVLAQFRAPEPLPRPGEPGAPGAAPGPAVAQPTGTLEPTQGWSPLLVVEGFYEQNVGFTAPPGPDDLAGSIQAAVTRWRRTPRGDIRLTVDGVGFVYRDLQNRNRADGGASLSGSRSLSPRVTANVTGRFAYAHSDTVGALVDGAVLLPLVRVVSGDAGGGISWQIGERTSASFDAGWSRVDFDSDVLVDTQTFSAGTSVKRRLSRNEGLSLDVQFLRIEDAISTRHEPNVTLGLTSQLSRTVSIGLAAGVGRSETVGAAPAPPPQWSALASAGLTVTRRRGIFAIHYVHGLQPIPGLGVTELTDLVGLNAVVPIGRVVEILARGSLAFRGDPRSEGARRRREGDVFAGGAMRLARRLRLVVGYRFRYRDDPVPNPGIRNNRGSVSLAWGPESLAFLP